MGAPGALMSPPDLQVQVMELLIWKEHQDPTGSYLTQGPTAGKWQRKCVGHAAAHCWSLKVRLEGVGGGPSEAGSGWLDQGGA